MRFFQKFYDYGLGKKYTIDSIILGYSEFLRELSEKNEKFDKDFLDQTYNELDDKKILLFFANAEKRTEEYEIKIVEDAKALAQTTLYGYLSHIHRDIKYVLKTWYLCILLIIIFFTWQLIAYPESLKLIVSLVKS